MSENLKKFSDMIANDKELEAKALACNELGEEKGRLALIELAKECGIELTEAQAASIFAPDAEPIIMTKRSKSGDKEVNILPMIHSVKAVAADGLIKIRATLRAGNTENLNPEYLVGAMRDRLGILPEDGNMEEVWYRILRIGFHDEGGVETGKWFR